MARTPCVKVKTKKEGAFACTLCREKKKKCVPHKPKPPPADVKKGDSAPLPKRPLKNAPFVPARSQKSNRPPSRDLSRDSTAPLPQRALKTAPTVPANSQKPNRRPTHDLTNFQVPSIPAPSIPASHSPTPELPQLLEARLRRIEEMQLSLSERQTSTLAAVEGIQELLLGWMASRTQRDSD